MILHFTAFMLPNTDISKKTDSHILSGFYSAEDLICWHIAWFGVKPQYFSGVVRCEGPLVDNWRGVKAIGAGAPAQGQCRPKPHSEEGGQDGKAHHTSHNNHHLRLTLSLNSEEICVLRIMTLGLICSWRPNWLGYLVGEPERTPKDENKGRSEDPSDLPYENLPFHGLRDPPKKVPKLEYLQIKHCLLRYSL